MIKHVPPSDRLDSNRKLHDFPKTSLRSGNSSTYSTTVFIAKNGKVPQELGALHPNQDFNVIGLRFSGRLYRFRSTSRIWWSLRNVPGGTGTTVGPVDGPRP